MMAPSKTKPAFSSFSVIVVFLALMVIGAAFVLLPDVRFKSSRYFQNSLMYDSIKTFVKNTIQKIKSIKFELNENAERYKTEVGRP